jgi:nitrite reductase/ring-hydroxylating ferredoxin subunit
MADRETWTAVARLGDIGPTRKLVRRLGACDVLLVRIGSDVLAVDDRCTHLGRPLHGGRVMSGQITCPFHGACFDLRTGEAVCGPAVSRLRCHEVRIEGDAVMLRLPADQVAGCGIEG